MRQRPPEHPDLRLVAGAAALVASRPIDVPGHDLRRASTVWVDLDAEAGDARRFRLTVTVFPIGADPDGLDELWFVVARPGDHCRYGRLDRNGQCRLSGLSPGRWGALLLFDADRPPRTTSPTAGSGSTLPDTAMLLRVASEDNPIACCEALDALRAFADGAGWPQDDIELVLGQMRNNPEAIVRRAAAELLGEVGGPSTVEPLLRALDDPAWSVQCAAAGSLGFVGDPGAVAGLAEVAGDIGRDPAVREAAVEALDRLGDFRSGDMPVPAHDDLVPPWHQPTAVGSSAMVTPSASVAAAEVAARRQATIDPAVGVVVEHDGVTLLVHPDPAEPTSDTVLITIRPGAGIDGLGAGLWAVGPEARLHAGVFDQHGHLVLRGVPRDLRYQLRLHPADREAETAPVEALSARSATPVLVRGSAEDPAPQRTPLLVVCDHESRTVIISRTSNDTLVVDVVGLGITDRRTIVALPIRVADGSVRLFAPLRWNHETGRCEAHLALLKTDRIDDGGHPRPLKVADLGPDVVADVSLSVHRACGDTPQAWTALAADGGLHPQIIQAVREALLAQPGED